MVIKNYLSWFFRRKFEELNDTPKEWYASKELQQLAFKVQQSYRYSTKRTANKNNIFAVVRAFQSLHMHLTRETDDNYFNSNFIKNDLHDYDTIEQAIVRTLEFIENEENLTTSQCEYFSRNLEVILRDYSFTKNPENIIAPYISEIYEVVNGDI
ncbi:hypothetical protein J9100_004023 [Vibrio vulnificus]|nr:hypothetical protein [Vibrio vulnificus]